MSEDALAYGLTSDEFPIGDSVEVDLTMCAHKFAAIKPDWDFATGAITERPATETPAAPTS